MYITWIIYIRCSDFTKKIYNVEYCTLRSKDGSKINKEPCVFVNHITLGYPQLCSVNMRSHPICTLCKYDYLWK